MITWALIFEAPEADPSTDRMDIKRGVRSIIVAVPEQAAVVQAAIDLVAEGAQFIELCGGLEPDWAGRIIEATGGKVPIGTVGYAGGQSVLAMAKIFSA